MIRAVAFLLCLALASALSAGAKAQTPPPRPVPANTLPARTHLILTVPLANAQTLAATAAAITNDFGVTLSAEWPLQSISVHCFVVEVGRQTDIDALVQRMRADARIRTVQRMQDFNTFASSKSARHFPVQQALVQLNAVAAQRISKGANVKVAIVDSAIDGTHPDLSGRVEALRDFVDDDRQGKGEAHGTAIAGIIGADATNATGMVGVAPDAELVGLRACWQAKGKAGHCNSFSLARALNFAILNHFDVINMSLGGPPDLLLGELIHAAIDSGAVVVAAWGESDKAAFPASVPGVIAAGRSADTAIPAPSVDVLSTAPHNHYNYVSGSSVAAAHVSGVVALLLAAHPGLHANDVAKTLHAAVEARHGKPMLDACQALDAVVDKPFSCTQ